MEIKSLLKNLKLLGFDLKEHGDNKFVLCDKLFTRNGVNNKKASESISLFLLRFLDKRRVNRLQNTLKSKRLAFPSELFAWLREIQHQHPNLFRGVNLRKTDYIDCTGADLCKTFTLLSTLVIHRTLKKKVGENIISYDNSRATILASKIDETAQNFLSLENRSHEEIADAHDIAHELNFCLNLPAHIEDEVEAVNAAYQEFIHEASTPISHLEPGSSVHSPVSNPEGSPASQVQTPVNSNHPLYHYSPSSSTYSSARSPSRGQSRDTTQHVDYIDGDANDNSYPVYSPIRSMRLEEKTTSNHAQTTQDIVPRHFTPGIEEDIDIIIPYVQPEEDDLSASCPELDMPDDSYSQEDKENISPIGIQTTTVSVLEQHANPRIALAELTLSPSTPYSLIYPPADTYLPDFRELLRQVANIEPESNDMCILPDIYQPPPTVLMEPLILNKPFRSTYTRKRDHGAIATYGEEKEKEISPSGSKKLLTSRLTGREPSFVYSPTRLILDEQPPFQRLMEGDIYDIDLMTPKRD